MSIVPFHSPKIVRAAVSKGDRLSLATKHVKHIQQTLVCLISNISLKHNKMNKLQNRTNIRQDFFCEFGSGNGDNIEMNALIFRYTNFQAFLFVFSYHFFNSSCSISTIPNLALNERTKKKTK